MTTSEQCSDGKVWSPSGKTCKGLTVEDPTENQEGCHCPNGTYWNEYTLKCAAKDQCGCVVTNGNDTGYYEKNATHPMDCSK